MIILIIYKYNIILFLHWNLPDWPNFPRLPHNSTGTRAHPARTPLYITHYICKTSIFKLKKIISESSASYQHTYNFTGNNAKVSQQQLIITILLSCSHQIWVASQRKLKSTKVSCHKNEAWNPSQPVCMVQLPPSRLFSEPFLRIYHNQFYNYRDNLLTITLTLTTTTSLL